MMQYCEGCADGHMTARAAAWCVPKLPGDVDVAEAEVDVEEAGGRFLD